MHHETTTMKIGITMGDAAGIGPEVLLKAWKEQKLDDRAVVFGDADVLSFCDQKLGFGVPMRVIKHPGEAQRGFLNVIDLGILTRKDLHVGQVDKQSGNAAAAYVTKAVEMALDGQIAAIVTLPMNKEATRLSIPDFSGHTELIAGLCGETDYTMMLTSERLTVSHVSTHVSMTQAVKAVTRERVRKVIQLTHDALAAYLETPRIAVAGLNPHAGENGAFGLEELEQVVPAIQDALAEGICCEGPIPPDTVFLKAVRGHYDAVVCMYHDQGHIPMKLLDFEGGVNVTLGLKVIRTSVDHGTAFDIAWQGVAATDSLAAAYRLACKMSGG